MIQLLCVVGASGWTLPLFAPLGRLLRDIARSTTSGQESHLECKNLV